MRRALVTGAAGMIGSNLVHQLLEDGANVLAVDDLSGGNEVFLPGEGTENYGFTQASVLSPDFADAVEAFKPTVIFHLAAYAAECLSPWIRLHNAQNNYVATSWVVSQAVKHDVGHVVFTSSAAVYGHTDFGFEDDASPADPYGITKLAGELDIKEAANRFGLHYTIFRPHNVYGRHQNLWDRYRNVVGIFMRQAMAGEPMTVYGDGTQIRQFTEVGDMVKVMAQSDTHLNLQDRTFNIGSDESLTVTQLAEAIQTLKPGAEISYLEARNEAHTVRTDHRKLKKAGFTCETPFATGLEAMWEWAQTAPTWEPVFPAPDHRKGLYSYWNES